MKKIIVLISILLISIILTGCFASGSNFKEDKENIEAENEVLQRYNEFYEVASKGYRGQETSSVDNYLADEIIFNHWEFEINGNTGSLYVNKKFQIENFYEEDFLKIFLYFRPYPKDWDNYDDWLTLFEIFKNRENWEEPRVTSLYNNKNIIIVRQELIPEGMIEKNGEKVNVEYEVMARFYKNLNGEWLLEKIEHKAYYTN